MKTDLKLKAALKIIKENKHCSFVTIGPDNAMNARVMTSLYTPETRKGVFYFATSASSRKAEDIGKRRIVMLTFFDPANREYVTVKGAAELLSDKKTRDKFWQAGWKAFWPGGKTSADYVVVKVKADEAELLQKRNSNKEFFYFE